MTPTKQHPQPAPKPAPKKIEEPEEFSPTEEDDSRFAIRPTKKNGIFFVTPFCQKDWPLLKQRCEYMRRKNLQSPHEIVLFADNDAHQFLNEAAQLHAGLFSTVHTYELKTNVESTTWPQTVNRVWRAIVRNMLFLKRTAVQIDRYKGWFFFESDMIPVCKDWGKKLEAEYMRSGKKFMGIVGAVQASNGQSVTHMNGGSVYPTSIQFYNEKMMLTTNLPWDVAGCTGTTLKEVHKIDSDVYTMGFSTCGYRDEGNGKFSATKHTVDGKTEAYSVVIKDQWIHHGCKDGTLHKLLMGETNEAIRATGCTEAPQETEDKQAASTVQAQEGTESRKTRPRKGADVQQVQGVRVVNADRNQKVRDDYYTNGIKWKDLLSKYKLSPKQAKEIVK